MDIREILNALDATDKQLFDKCRTDMRKAYLVAHNKVHGINNWSRDDDAFLDMIDIKVAALFDNSGRFNATKNVIGKEDAVKIEANLHKQDDNIKNKLALIEPSNIKLPINQW